MRSGVSGSQTFCCGYMTSPSGEFCVSVPWGSLCLSLLGVCVSISRVVCASASLGKVCMSAPPGRLEAAAMTYPKEVAQGHRETDGEGGGAQVVSTTLVCGSEDAEHQLQGQEKLHSDSLASCRVVAELGKEGG